MSGDSVPLQDASPVATPPVRKASAFRTVSCLLISLCLVFIGIAALLDPDLWPDEKAIGGVVLAAGIFLFPPILEPLRRKFPWLRPTWAPVIIVVLLLPAACVISRPFAPAPAERGRLEAQAIRDARIMLQQGKTSDARLKIRHFTPPRGNDPALQSLLADIGAVENTAAGAAKPTHPFAGTPRPTEVHPPVGKAPTDLKVAGDTFAESLVVSKAKLLELLKDPDSAKFQDVQGYSFITNDGTRLFIFCGKVNSKGGFGGYVGYQRFIATPEGAIIETDPSFELGWNQRCTGPARDVFAF